MASLLACARRVSGWAGSQMSGAVFGQVRFATHKAGGKSKNGRKASPSFLGVKKFGGEKVAPGNIIIRQRGTKWHPGDQVGLGRDHTIWALVPGWVKFKYDITKKKTFVSVVDKPPVRNPCKAYMVKKKEFKERAKWELWQAKLAKWAAEKGHPLVGQFIDGQYVKAPVEPAKEGASS